jgi:DNA repair protein RadC
MNFTRLNDGRIQFNSPVSLTELAKTLEVLLSEKLLTEALTDPNAAMGYVQARCATLEHEVFGVVWLDNRHRVISVKHLFRGTIDGASVHPREVAKDGLINNAAAALFFHNHPSMDPTPSAADRAITARLKDALALIDIRVLDHFVVGAKVESFARMGLI